MRKIAALLLILGLLFSVVVTAEEIPQEIHIEGYDTVIVGLFEIWKHSDGTWQDTDYDGICDKPYVLDKRTISAQLQAPIPEAITNQYDNISYEIIPMTWEMDINGENEALFKLDLDGYSAVIKEDMGLEVNADTYSRFYLQVLNMRPKNYRAADEKAKDGKVDFILQSDPTRELKRNWQGKQVEGYGFYLPAIVKYYGTQKKNTSKDSISNIDLSAQIMSCSDYAIEGNPVTVKAEIKHNTPGKNIITRVLWKLNGEVIKDTANFGFLGSYEDAVSFIMPAESAKISVIVNPNQDCPASELDWNNNSNSRIINLKDVKTGNNNGLVCIIIDAPDVVGSVKDVERGIFSYSVIIEATSSIDHWEYSTDCWTDDKGNEYCSTSSWPMYKISQAEVKIWTRGGMITTKYNPYNPTDRTDTPVEMNNPAQYFYVQGPSWVTKTYKYTHQQVGVVEADHYVNIVAEVELEEVIYRAIKKVIIKGYPAKDVGIELLE